MLESAVIVQPPQGVLRLNWRGLLFREARAANHININASRMSVFCQ